MKRPGQFFALTLLLAGASAPLWGAAVRDVAVIDFTDMPRNTDGSHQRGYDYAYGDWSSEVGKGVIQVHQKGLLVNLLGSKGGMGERRGLDFAKHTLARFNFVIGNRNEAGTFTFNLVDTDGTEQSWDVSLRDQPKGILLNPLVDLAKPSREDKPGKKPGLNLKRLSTWQIRGNYQDEPIEILFLKVTAVSE